MGKKKDKKTKDNEKDEVVPEVDPEQDKDLFKDIFGVSIEEVEKEDRSEAKYESILDDIKEVQESIKDENTLSEKEEVIFQDDSVIDAIEILETDFHQQRIEFKDKREPIETQEPLIPPPKIIKPIVEKPLVIPKISQLKESSKDKSPILSIPPPPKVKKIQIKTPPINIQRREPVKEEEIKLSQSRASDEVKAISIAPGVMKPINLRENIEKEPPVQEFKVAEPKTGFKVASLFVDQEDSEQKQSKIELSEIRCANCGTRITKEAEASLKEGWIISCEHCGHQIITG